MKKFMGICFLISVFSIFLHASEGEEVYQEKCASCHEAYIPMTKLMENFVEQENKLLKLKAPTINQLSYRLKQQIGDPKGDEEIHRMEVGAFISDYLKAPDKQKSVCLRDVIQYFDTMPSMKGQMSGDEIASVSEYIYDFDKKTVAEKGVKHEFFDTALHEAQKSNKVIVLKAMTEHCHFCKKMDREVLIDASVVKALTKDFIVVQVDITKSSLPLGLTAELTPTFFFINKNKKVLQKIVGSWNVEDFLEILKEINHLKGVRQ
jgi:thioredoxin-related protein